MNSSPPLWGDNGMRSRYSKFLSLVLSLATLLMWLEGASVGSGAEYVSSNAFLAAHPHVSLESPCLRSFPTRPGETFWVLGEPETIDLDEEDGQMAVLANIGLDLQPVVPPSYPFLLDSIAPERDTSLFLSLGRFRC